MWAITRSGVSVEYLESCASCLYVYLDLPRGEDTESAMTAVTKRNAGVWGDAI